MYIQWEFKTRDLDKSGVLEANEIAWMLEEGEGCMIGFLRSCDYDNKKGISQREWEMCFPPTLGGIVILPLVTWGTFFVAKKKKRKEKKKKKKKKKKRRPGNSGWNVEGGLRLDILKCQKFQPFQFFAKWKAPLLTR